jgi:hypothetical protein
LNMSKDGIYTQSREGKTQRPLRKTLAVFALFFFTLHARTITEEVTYLK